MSTQSPYRPPQAAVADQDRPRGSPVKGMLFGVLVDVGGSMVAAFILFFIWAIWLGASGLDAEAITQAMVENDPMSGISLTGYGVGAAFSWLGGYVCARVAKETELRCAAVVAAVSAALALAMGTELPLPLNLLLAALTVGAVMLGGWMGAQRNARQP
jgi:uncharacterized membrane protein